MSEGYLAVDLGAESGRVVLGHFDGGRVWLEEVHRFPTMPVRLPDGLHWDVLRILCEIKVGLAKAMRQEKIEGIGIDSWGVDFGLLDGEGALVSNPYHHRDARTEAMMEEAFGLVPKEEIYQTTGIQFLPINTLYQLLAMRRSPLLGADEPMLLIPHRLMATREVDNAQPTHTEAHPVLREDQSALVVWTPVHDRCRHAGHRGFEVYRCGSDESNDSAHQDVRLNRYSLFAPAGAMVSCSTVKPRDRAKTRTSSAEANSHGRPPSQSSTSRQKLIPRDSCP